VLVEGRLHFNYFLRYRQAGIRVVFDQNGINLFRTYLRYFQPHFENEGILGDDSDHFTWASLFPKKAQPVAIVIGKTTFRIIKRFGFCRKRLLQMESFDIGLESVETVIPHESRDADRKRFVTYIIFAINH
jgi:hypothetical protein